MTRQCLTRWRPDLVTGVLVGDSVLSLVKETSVLESTLQRWKHRVLVDVGLIDDLESAESAHLIAVNKSITALGKGAPTGRGRVWAD